MSYPSPTVPGVRVAASGEKPLSNLPYSSQLSEDLNQLIPPIANHESPLLFSVKHGSRDNEPPPLSVWDSESDGENDSDSKRDDSDALCGVALMTTSRTQSNTSPPLTKRRNNVDSKESSHRRVEFKANSTPRNGHDEEDEGSNDEMDNKEGIEAATDIIVLPPKTFSFKCNLAHYILAAVLLSLLIVLVVVAATRGKESSDVLYGDPCSVYCDGDLLDAVQMLNIYNDSKTFVDMPLLTSPKTVLQAFGNVQRPLTANSVKRFLSEHFADVGGDLVKAQPSDWNVDPKFIANIRDTTLQSFAKQVHAIWPTLCYTTSPNVRTYDYRTSSLSLPNSFILPGGRFREVYYWDTYFIIRGLLISDMTTTAKGIVGNFIDLIQRYGHVPNGSRRYYLNRSQPPLLTVMVDAIWQHTNDWTFVTGAMPSLLKEYEWFQTQRSISVVSIWDGSHHKLNHYNADTTKPRPESYREDRRTATLSSRPSSLLFQDLAAAAESGMDFSSRWFSNGALNSTHTSDIVPVCLNAILYRVEVTLAKWLKNSDASRSTALLAASQQRAASMTALLYDAKLARWRDYHSKSTTGRGVGVYITDWLPLWAGLRPPSRHLLSSTAPTPSIVPSAVVQSLQSSGLILPGGLSISLTHSNEQWDFPNAWPPMTLMIVEALEDVAAESKDSNASILAQSLSQTYISHCFLSFVKTGYMFEKYDSRGLDKGSGGGGEYSPQTGFGWSNGTLLSLLFKYGQVMAAPISPSPTSSPTPSPSQLPTPLIGPSMTPTVKAI